MKKTIFFIIAAAIAIFGLVFWAGRADKPASTPPLGDSLSVYQLSDVQKHPDVSSCWSAINGKVYDLTAWVNQHPGGQANLLKICGQDGTAAFSTKHGEKPRPQDELTKYLIGQLINQ